MATIRIKWNPEDTATPELIAPMLDNIGVGEESIVRAYVARQATREYCLLLMRDSEIPMGDLELQAGAFYDGFLKGLDGVERMKDAPDRVSALVGKLDGR